MLKVFHSPEDYLSSRTVSTVSSLDVIRQVSDIISEVRQHGNEAVREFTHRFDQVRLQELKVSQDEIDEAVEKLHPEIKAIFLSAIENVRQFHEKQLPQTWIEHTSDGSSFGMQYTPIERVGCYVPGGTAGYPSSVIMTVVPAQIAEVEQILLVTPPTKDCRVNELVLAAAGLLGVKDIFAIGGAQAMAALAFGTRTIPKVNKIVGPGNVYVNEAKRQLFGVVGIDSLAGPTEVVILADESSNAEYVTQDLFAQAEHDPEARAILVTPSQTVAEKVQEKAEAKVQKAARNDILKSALKDFGAVVLVSDLDVGTDLVNEIAPEHLHIMTRNADSLLSSIRNAGAIFLGASTPVVLGDYCSGPNHVLPTAQTAKFSSSLNVLDFMKFSSVLKYSKTRFQELAPAVAKFAELEGLLNHKQSVEIRNE